MIVCQSEHSCALCYLLTMLSDHRQRCLALVYAVRNTVRTNDTRTRARQLDKMLILSLPKLINWQRAGQGERGRKCYEKNNLSQAKDKQRSVPSTHPVAITIY